MTCLSKKIFRSLAIAIAFVAVGPSNSFADPVNFPWLGSNVTFQFRYPVDFSSSNKIHIWQGQVEEEKCFISLLANDALPIISPQEVFDIEGNSEVSVWDGVGSVRFYLFSPNNRVRFDCSGLRDAWEDRLVRMFNTFIKFIGLPQVRDDEIDGQCLLPDAPENPAIRTSTCSTRLEIFCHRRTFYRTQCKRLSESHCSKTGDIDGCIVAVFDEHYDSLAGTYQTRETVNIAFDNAAAACHL